MEFGKLKISHLSDKQEIYGVVREEINDLGLKVVDEDFKRPWGGFFRFDSQEISRFGPLFFPELDYSNKFKGLDLSPKFLIVEPNKRLSWQVHARRAEVWKVVDGPVGIYLSENDTQPEEMRVLAPGELVSMDKEVRHRLVGLDKWGLVAEIWVHTDPDNPSDESDIVRLQDDFSR